MCMLYSPLREVGEPISADLIRQSGIHGSVSRQTSNSNKRINSVVLLEFRDEVYATIACLLEQLHFVAYRAENSTELARQVVRNSPDLVLLNGTHPDESAWLTCAKLRIVDSSRPVWVYTPKSASAIDQWLSMASSDEIIIYGGVLDVLHSALSDRLSLCLSNAGYIECKVVPQIAL